MSENRIARNDSAVPEAESTWYQCPKCGDRWPASVCRGWCKNASDRNGKCDHDGGLYVLRRIEAEAAPPAPGEPTLEEMADLLERLSRSSDRGLGGYQHRFAAFAKKLRRMTDPADRPR